MRHDSIRPRPAPRIYVASLADYNAGRFHGVWIDAIQDPSAILEAIRTMLRSSRIEEAEEWAIHDHEGFRGVRVAENAAITQLVEIARGIHEHRDAQDARGC